MSGDVVSIVMATYNRSATLRRAIDSVFSQDYRAWQLIVVNDGSTDETTEVLRAYDDRRMTVVVHDGNRGVTATKNTGLNHVRGEWFTFLDSDDEIVPSALSTLLAVAEDHPDATAIDCNCIDSVTREFTGHGIDEDGYVDAQTHAKALGEHWGIAKTEVHGSIRFDERLPGFEGITSLKIGAHARSYYINCGLRIYHREGSDRVSHQSRERLDEAYLLVSEDMEYLSLLKELNPEEYSRVVFRVVVAAGASGEQGIAWRFLRFYRGPLARRAFLLSVCTLGSPWVKAVRRVRARLSGR